jgi:hypothetical protein
MFLPDMSMSKLKLNGLSFLAHKKTVPSTLAFCSFLVTCDDVMDEGSTYIKPREGAHC